VKAVTLNLDGLKKLQGQLTELEAGEAHVGIFAANANRRPDRYRPGSKDDNVSIGFAHEFGGGLPRRSFLLAPLSLHLGPLILAKGEDWMYVLRTQGVKSVLRFLGRLGEDIVQEAFATRGFGFWPELHPDTIAKKKARGRSTAILIEMEQMRNSISSRVI